MLPKKREVMTSIWKEMDAQFANYIRGKAIEILIVGSVSFIIFLLIDQKKIEDNLKPKLAKFKQPKYYIFVEELPRNAMGKIQKASLREQFKEVFKS